MPSEKRHAEDCSSQCLSNFSHRRAAFKLQSLITTEEEQSSLRHQSPTGISAAKNSFWVIKQISYLRGFPLFLVEKQEGG